MVLRPQLDLQRCFFRVQEGWRKADVILSLECIKIVLYICRDSEIHPALNGDAVLPCPLFT